jgi:nitrite reductase (NADH) small subunit
MDAAARRALRSCMTQLIKVCAVDDIPVLGARCVQRAGAMDVAVFRNSANEVFALLDRCPHKGGPLSQGIVFGRSVACPLHNWTIGLDDGCAKAPDEGCTVRFTVTVQDAVVYLDRHELDTLGRTEQPPVAGPLRHSIPIIATPEA